MFERCRILLEEYAVVLRLTGMTRRADHLLQEARARLRQLQWLHARLLELEQDLQQDGLKALPPGQARPDVFKQLFLEQSAAKSDPQVEAHLPFQTSDELRILLETFYYSAHRVLDILTDHKLDLPGVRALRVQGVREVRNHLVEHPSRDRGVLVYSTACGGPVGPQLRLLRWSLDPPGTEDRGLHENAREFEGALESCLTRALSTLGDQ